MTKAHSLLIGLNSFDKTHYGHEGKLKSPRNDVKKMQELLTPLSYISKSLLDTDATRQNVIDEIKKASQELNPGDIFVLFYSGHGGKLPSFELNGNQIFDQTWCLHNAQFFDDELRLLLLDFKEDVRIFAISDSCYSGGMIDLNMRLKRLIDKWKTSTHNKSLIPARELLFPFPDTDLQPAYNFYTELRKEIQKKKQEQAGKTVKANVRFLSASQVNKPSIDGSTANANSVFTKKMLDVWNNGAFSGNYETFYDEILNGLTHLQTPQHILIGKPNTAYDEQTPFQV